MKFVCECWTHIYGSDVSVGTGYDSSYVRVGTWIYDFYVPTQYV